VIVVDSRGERQREGYSHGYEREYGHRSPRPLTSDSAADTLAEISRKSRLSAGDTHGEEVDQTEPIDLERLPPSSRYPTTSGVPASAGT
jgi:hypothetical protein